MRRTCSIAVLAVAMATGAARADETLFRNRVAPILERRCLHCHSGKTPGGGLSLATAAAAFAGGNSGPAIEPGNPEESLLFDMLAGERPKMPKNADPLEEKEVDSIRRWIAAGAQWPAEQSLTPRWWSLEPVRLPVVPKAGRDWARSPIDAFVVERQAAKGLGPSAQADRPTLIRRLFYDLIGLPPSPAEVDEFLADPSPDAYERLVDRLLASPRYGERWARHWLDVVHFGETHGYDKDKLRPNSWPYRDYVIRALNDDRPYDRFVQEQLAGDVLYPDEPDGIIGTGFIAAGPWDFVGHVELREGTLDKEVTRSNDRDDMLTTAMSTFLSLTVHCARCHDHKFDPITQADYYRVQAVFAGVDRADRPYDTDAANHRRRRSLTAERAAVLSRQNDLDRRIRQVGGDELATIERDVQTVRKELEDATKTEGSPTNGYHSAIAASPDVVKWVQVDLGRPMAVERVRLIPARPTDFADTPGFGFPLRYRVEVADDPAFRDRTILADHTAMDTANPSDSPITIEGQTTRRRYVRLTATRLWERSSDYVLALAEMQVVSAGRNVALGAAVTAHDSIEAGRWSTRGLVDGYSSRRRLEQLADQEKSRSPIVARLDALLQKRKGTIERRVDAATLEQWRETTLRLSAIDERLTQLPAPARVYAASNSFAGQGTFTSAKTPRPVHLLRRGDVRTPGPLMPPGALACVAGAPHEFALENPDDEGARRAALARWITAPNNPLTRRSIVNRLWQHHFGRGIVDSPNDFGRMGALPTHPELLDWLACELGRSFESLKHVHRQMVCSATYRQISRNRSPADRMDGENRWLWRMQRRRLDAESLRDAALAVGGRLDLAMGGPSQQWFQFEDDHSPRYLYQSFDIASPASFRRSIYRFIVRSVPDPFMDCLDCPDASVWTPKRNVSVTAVQALAAWNNAFMVRQSAQFAARIANEELTMQDRITLAYRLALGRAPTQPEAALLAKYAASFDLANACRVLLNSNEFLFVD